MKGKRSEYEQLEDLLARAHMPESSPELKERITAEARKVWNQTSMEVSWRIPIRRLVASAAAAVLIVTVTNYSSDRALNIWRSGEALAGEQLYAELETLTEMPYGPFAKHLATVSRKPLATDASALRDHVDTVRRSISESQQNGKPVPSAPSGRSSRLLPDRHGIGSYS